MMTANDAKQEAVRRILTVLRNPLMLMSPDRQVAIELAREHGVTAEDLLSLSRRKAENA